MNEPPNVLRDADIEEDDCYEEFRNYLSRFDYRHWARVLQECAKTIRAEFKAVMRKFNDPTKIVSFKYLTRPPSWNDVDLTKEGSSGKVLTKPTSDTGRGNVLAKPASIVKKTAIPKNNNRVQRYFASLNQTLKADILLRVAPREGEQNELAPLVLNRRYNCGGCTSLSGWCPRVPV